MRIEEKRGNNSRDFMLSNWELMMVLKDMWTLEKIPNLAIGLDHGKVVNATCNTFSHTVN